VDAAVALAPLASLLPTGIDSERAVAEVRAYADDLLAQVGLAGVTPPPRPQSPARRPARKRAVAAPRAGRPARTSSVAAPGAATTPDDAYGQTGTPGDGYGQTPTPQGAYGQTPTQDGAYDYVGIVMAKSAEGDAVAEILGRRGDVVVHEQPAFWDIRAQDRLVIPYEDVSEELGYQIDAYSIQHEMSTHYGRMVATDEALMLFSDPTEAMEHLMS
jgi:propane monooxygenase coupling protein